MFIEDNRNIFHINNMCAVLSVTRSSYYQWLKRPVSKTELSNKELLGHIKAIHTKTKARYGVLRITAELKAQGIGCSKNRVARLMKKGQIKSKTARKYKRTTDSNHRQQVSDNKVKMQFNPEKPNKLWTTDITYIWTTEGWLYLVVFLDLFSRLVISWSIKESLDETLVTDALAKAISDRKPEDGFNSDLVIHSDRGSQYASLNVRKLMAENNIIQSMSSKGNCYDNAPAESFFSTLKRELIYREHYKTREEAKRSIFEYIEIFYNRQRRHSTLGYLSPSEFENCFLYENNFQTKNINNNKNILT